MANNYKSNMKANNNKQKQNFSGSAKIAQKTAVRPSNSLGEMISGLIQKLTTK